MWRYRSSGICASALNLSPSNGGDSRHEEEKSNNLQNEENFRRYANPLKGSVASLRGAIELSLQPVPEISQTVTLAGPSIVHRSQPLFPACDSDFDKESDHSKSHRGSQILLYKAQNPDMRKNTVGSIESPHKDFGKRSINCQSMPPIAIDQDVLTVHVWTGEKNEKQKNKENLMSPWAAPRDNTRTVQHFFIIIYFSLRGLIRIINLFFLFLFLSL